MRLLLLLILSATLVFVFSCKPEKQECHDPSNPECENYDPCYGQKPVTAEIVLSQRAAPGVQGELGKLYLEGDSIFPQIQIKFSTPLAGAKYTWTLGAETITTQSFERDFFTAPYGVYTVKLVVEKNPNLQCFPHDNGMDTFVKTFRIVPVCKLESGGVFKGKWDNSSADSAIVTVRTYRDGSYTDSCAFGITRFTNLQNKQDTLLASCILSNTQAIQDIYPALGFRKLNLKINPQDKSTVIDFYMSEKHYTFRGRKIAD